MTGEKPEYMQSGLALSKDLHYPTRNNSNDCHQALRTTTIKQMNNMGMERGRMSKELDSQSSGQTTAKIAHKTAAAASTFRRGNNDPYDSDSDPSYHFSYFVQDRLETRLANVRAAYDVFFFANKIHFFANFLAFSPNRAERTNLTS